jgi:integrase
MKNRYRAFRRGWGVYYCEDTQTGKQESLATTNRKEADRLVHAKNEGEQHPAFSLQLARVYWKAADPAGATRTWQQVMEEAVKTKVADTRHRWETAIKDKAFGLLRHRVVLETTADEFLRVLENGSVSTNVFLRRIHNLALDMNWLPWPVIPKKQWPPVRFGHKRAITRAEHEKIVARETNPERQAFYQLAWHLGASQTDIALLEAANVDWDKCVVSYARKKTGELAFVHFGPEVAEILRRLPQVGPLFPYMRKVRAGDRATEFKQRCAGLGIAGVSLHSYRYAWAERAKQCGYPERFAQEALGHNSKAVHRAYARHAKVVLPSLESFEKHAEARTIVPFPVHPESETPAATSAQR